MKILIVEDNEMNRDMLTRRLTRKGYRVVCAFSGPQGIELAEAEQPTVILMDIALGDMDGIEATEIIKARPTTAHIPIIALTAHALETDRQRCFAAGCVEFETKPVDLPRLLAKIEAAAAGRGLRADAAE